MPKLLSDEAAERLRVSASTVFTPRTPVSTRELFAGRTTQLIAAVDAIAQIGLHAVVFGERGVGKTSLTHVIAPILTMIEEHKAAAGSEPRKRIVVRINANSRDTFATVWSRVLGEVEWLEERPALGFTRSTERARLNLGNELGIGDSATIDDVRRVLSQVPGAVFIIDEFDRLPKEQSPSFTDLIKALSDGAVDVTIVLVGVAETVEQLLMDHASIGRALVQIPMPRMTEAEIDQILANAESGLGVTFGQAARTRIVRISQGLPHFTHLIGLHAVRAAAQRKRSNIDLDEVNAALGEAVSQSDQSVAAAYATAVHSAHSGAKFAKVLLAAAVAAYRNGDELGYFQAVHLVEPMALITGRDETIAGFNGHLAQFLEQARGSVLERRGAQRQYRYRFSVPLMPPYVIMRSVRDGIIPADALTTLLP